MPLHNSQSTMTEQIPLPLGTTVGILGGGQLGRMLSLAASHLGMKTHIYCPDVDSPAFEVTPHKTIAAYEDKTALRKFADAVDIITYEFENVPIETAEFLANLKQLSPGPRALAISQDRIVEKDFLSRSDIPVTPYRAVNSLDDLLEAVKDLGLPAVLKTTRMGYDGKGQRIIKKPNQVVPAYTALGKQPLVLEKFVAFEKEISVVVASNARGQIKDFDASENVHKNHILHTSTVPANIEPLTARKASRIAHQIAGSIDYIGVLSVEFFVIEENGRQSLLVNEIAPRVHNSGHWTQSVCATDQFEQHIRAILNWPLGDPSRMADVQMENLIGDEVSNVAEAIKLGDQPYIYGKTAVRNGRKMGHINHLKL
jgi:5-(carboxyamino)imidazole ribonucleotide synthase